MGDSSWKFYFLLCTWCKPFSNLLCGHIVKVHCALYLLPSFARAHDHQNHRNRYLVHTGWLISFWTIFRSGCCIQMSQLNFLCFLSILIAKFSKNCDAMFDVTINTFYQFLKVFAWIFHWNWNLSHPVTSHQSYKIVLRPTYRPPCTGFFE